MKIDEFKEELKKLKIEFNDEMLNKLEEYYNLLIEWNKKMNLTRIVSKNDVYLKHFYDSLTIVKCIDLSKSLNLVDVGTGAGFPGIVLKIFFPSLNIILIESLEKKVKFLKEIIKKLNLKNIEIINMRAEDFSRKVREKYDLVVSRAVAKLNILTEICTPMLKKGGYFIALKAKLEEELEESKNSINLLNCELIEVVNFNLPYENSIRNIVKIKKIEKCKNVYPRNFNKINKNPL